MAITWVCGVCKNHRRLSVFRHGKRCTFYCSVHKCLSDEQLMFKENRKLYYQMFGRLFEVKETD